MQKGPSQVTSGNIAPTISGPKKDKDIIVVSGLVVSLAAVIGAFWYYSSADQPYQPSPSSSDKLTDSQVSEVLKNGNHSLITPVSLNSQKVQDVPIAAVTPGTIHTDLFFELGRKGLTDEAKSLLQEKATLLKADPNMGVLVQGYTDQQGSSSYNMKLGMKRAESVKQELIDAGVAEHQIKAVSLGEEGVLCIDRSDVCRRMNRRVHLEIRTIGQEHMALPVETPEPVAEVIPTVDTPSEAETTQASVDPATQTDEANSVVDSLIPSANASEPEGPKSTAFDPTSGS